VNLLKLESYDAVTTTVSMSLISLNPMWFAHRYVVVSSGKQ